MKKKNKGYYGPLLAYTTNFNKHKREYFVNSLYYLMYVFLENMI